MAWEAALFAAAQRIIECAAETYSSRAELVGQFPFLAGYGPEFASAEGAPDGPLRALREEAGLSEGAIELLLAIGIIEEDARFAAVFDAAQSVPLHRPTLGLLTAWWRDDDGCAGVRAELRALLDLGLVETVNAEAPRLEWALQPNPVVWDALRGERHEFPAPGLRYNASDKRPALGDLILPDSVRDQAAALPALLASGEIRAVVVRGPMHNGRRSLAGAIARALGRGTLELAGARPAENRALALGPLAATLHAMPVFLLDPAPGETLAIPAVRGYAGPVGIVLGRQGAASGPDLERAITFHLEMPEERARLLGWRSALGPAAGPETGAIAARFRMTSGNIRRAATLSKACAALDGRNNVTLADAREAGRALNRRALDALAVRIPASGDWSTFAAAPETLAELHTLEARCRNRERLSGSGGAGPVLQPNCGVRALFKGPSGTGKTLAATVLAATLGMDVYRLDLSTVVNKYIGETEKSLSQVFARAEELDVILLIDEGDSLLTQRTAVQTSNDRYANLETNYLLQRLETFEGILIVTTNAGDRIDSAFQRRMDVVLDFHPPDAAERMAIWQLHLPVAHAIAFDMLQEVARRCALTGGQIRNAVLHTALLAMEDGGEPCAAHLEAAVEREYRKAGAVCPLRRAAAAGPR